MNTRKGGLGRGLAALIPTAPVEPPPTDDRDGPSVAASASSANARPGLPPPHEVPGAVYREIDIAAIRPNPQQPRQGFDVETISELAHSIREFGLLQPIVVREIDDDGFELVMGERRWRAAQQAGLATLPAIVRRTQDDEMLRDALLENIHRVQLNPLEEAAAYEQLLAEFGVTQTELADRIGRSRPVVTNTIRLLRLPVPVQRRVAAGVLSAGHARALLGLGDPVQQDELAARIVAEGMSVRAAEEAVVLAGSAAGAAASDGSRRRMANRTTDRADAAALRELADRMSDALDTRVKVELGQRKGRIVVEFGSMDDLERIAALVAGD